MQLRLLLPNRAVPTHIQPHLLLPAVRILRPHPDLNRPELQDPPALGVDQLVIQPRHGVKVILRRLRREDILQILRRRRIRNRTALRADGQERRAPRQRRQRLFLVLVHQHRRRANHGLRWRLVHWPQRVHVEALLCEARRAEEDAGVAFKALPQHPAQRDA